ncbi:MAG: PadR family transcriptional regulator [Ignavibacteria bacterium]
MAAENEDKTTANWMKEAQKGIIRMGVLILINKKPSHGYEIMKEINCRTKGYWQPTAGGVYPILRDLEKSGYIKGQWQTQKNRRLRVYQITESGEQILRKAILKQTEITNNIGNLFREFARDVLNIELENWSVPQMPSPLSPFLDEKIAAERNIEQLEHERKHIYEALTTMRSRLKLLDRRIAEIKKEERPDSSAA